jgi:hypothetical protein
VDSPKRYCPSTVKDINVTTDCLSLPLGIGHQRRPKVTSSLRSFWGWCPAVPQIAATHCNAHPAVVIEVHTISLGSGGGPLDSSANPTNRDGSAPALGLSPRSWMSIARPGIPACRPTSILDFPGKLPRFPRYRCGNDSLRPATLGGCPAKMAGFVFGGNKNVALLGTSDPGHLLNCKPTPNPAKQRLRGTEQPRHYNFWNASSTINPP